MSEEKMERAISALRKGRMVVVTSRADGHEEAACVTAAARTTPAHVNFMVRNARGLVCVALSKLMGERLNLQPQMASSRHPRAEDVMVSVEARTGVTTGISASDRARTIALLGHTDTLADDVISPGHVIPVTVSPKGLYSRWQIPEGSVDLVRIAGFTPSAAYCKMLTPEGQLMTCAEAEFEARANRFPVVDLEDISQFRAHYEVLVSCEAEFDYETDHGTFTLKSYSSDFDESRHLALVVGDLSTGAPLVRIHSQCLTGDVFGSLRCDCGEQLEESIARIAEEGSGALVYLLQEGRGIGLVNKVRAYALQDAGQDTVEANLSLGFQADQRDFRVAAQILTHLEITACRLLTNNPRKIEALERFGVEVRERVSLEISPAAHTHGYLSAKKQKMGHLLDKV
jgi:3,4-dihydroxy 2-butanone 4-phosphate synthase/GTP cyclohydrolase II